MKNFRLQYWEGTGWKDIEETIENNARYTQSFFLFKTPVTSSRIRFIATDKGSIKVREIKLFDEESVKNIPESYDISGIQRHGTGSPAFCKRF